jgi:hypothetical protein
LAVAGPACASTATQSVRSFNFSVKATTTVRTQAIGNGGIAFYASTGPNAFIVPRFFSGSPFAVWAWPKLFFPARKPP